MSNSTVKAGAYGPARTRADKQGNLRQREDLTEEKFSQEVVRGFGRVLYKCLNFT